MREATVGSDRMRRAGVWNEGKDERVMCHFLFSNTINHIRSTRSSFPTLATLVPLASLVWYEWSEGRMTEPVSDTRDRSEVAHGGWAWHRETDHAQPSYVHHEPPHPYPTTVPRVPLHSRDSLTMEASKKWGNDHDKNPHSHPLFFMPPASARDAHVPYASRTRLTAEWTRVVSDRRRGLSDKGVRPRVTRAAFVHNGHSHAAPPCHFVTVTLTIVPTLVSRWTDERRETWRALPTSSPVTRYARPKGVIGRNEWRWRMVMMWEEGIP